VLLDGFVCATWKKERTRETVALLIEPFASLATKDRDSLAKEGERLVRFIRSGAEAFEVRFAQP